MPLAPNHPTPRSWPDRVLILLFLLLLWLPFGDSCLHLDSAPPPGENRLPNPRPHWTGTSFAGSQKYCASYEAYYNDHYGFRKQLIRWYQHWKNQIFRDRSVYRVTIGQDGWLFWSQDDMVENYLGLTPFTPDDLRAWQTLLESRRDWLAQQGIPYIFIIPPDKHNIYPEYLPPWLVRATPARRVTRLDQFLDYMRTHSTVEILDLRASLLAAKADGPLYLKNDTHWNAYGAFVGCQEAVRTLSRRVPGLPVLRREDFVWTNTASPLAGDLGQMIGTASPEQNYYDFTAKPYLPGIQVVHTTNTVLGVVHKNCTITTSQGPLTKTAVIFNDSFGERWMTYLGYEFKQATFYQDNRDFNRQIILDNHPDVVINEMLERYFDTLDPRLLMAKEKMP